MLRSNKIVNGIKAVTVTNGNTATQTLITTAKVVAGLSALNVLKHVLRRPIHLCVKSEI